MLEPGQAKVAIAHRVERRDMNGSMARDIELPRKPPPLPSPRSTGGDEPLDLSKPLDLSRKPTKLDHVVTSLNGDPLAGRLSYREHQRKSATSMDMDEKSAKYPLLGSTRYPLQRGLAYVQPRQVRPSRQVSINGSHAPSPQSAKNPSPERLSPEQLKPQRNYTAMHQRVRAEAANIAALQAQATQAAQAAVSKALARQQALAAQETSTVQRKQIAETREATSRQKQTQPQLQQPPPTQQTPTQPHSQSGYAKIQDRQNLHTHSERLASVKRRQRQLSPEELKQYMMQRHFAQLSARRGIQSEQDLLRAYQSLTGAVPYSSNSVGQPQKTRTSPSTNGSKPGPRQQTMPRTRDSQQERELVHAHISHNQQKTISDHIAANKASSFAAQVKAREQAMIKQQQELILRRQRQMLDDVNNNRKLLEYARKEKEREGIIRDMNLKQYASLAKAQLERFLQKDKCEQKIPQSSPNQEYLKAIAAYSALYAGHTQAALLGSTSPPAAVSVLKKKPPPNTPRRTLPGSSIQPRTVQSTHNNSHVPAVKRPATSIHSDMPPPKKQTTYPSPQSSKASTAPADEARRLGLFQTMMLNSARENRPNIKSSIFPTDKKLSSMPVKDRLELARRKTERGHQEAMFLSKCAELMQSRVLGYPVPDSTGQTPSPLGEILRIPDEETSSGQPALAALQNDIAKRIASHTNTASVTTPQTKMSIGDFIDLTADTSAQKASSKSPETVQAHQPNKRERRLPSYDDAVAAQRTAIEQKKHPDKITPDFMSSVAKRLVSSSQEWLKEYMTREKDSHSKGYQETVVDKVMNDKDFALRIPRSIPVSSARNDSPSSLKTLEKIPTTISDNSSTATHSIMNAYASQHILQIPAKVGSTKGTDDKSDGAISNHHEMMTPPTIIRSVSHDPGTTSVPEEKHAVQQASSTAVDIQPTGPIPHQAEAKQAPSEDCKSASAIKEESVSAVAKDASSEKKGPQSDNDLMQADTSTLGKEERALQRAIIRFNDPEKQVSEESTQETEFQKVDVVVPDRQTTRVQKRKKRKLSKFRRRIRALRNMTSSSGQEVAPISGRKRGRPRLSALPPASMGSATMRSKFQDFVPTVLDHRTRNAGLDRVRNYRSMYDARNVRYELEIEKERAKVLERRRRLREYGNVESASATETDEPVQEEDCAPPVTKRPRGRPKMKKGDENGGAQKTSTSAYSDQKSTVSPSQPLRVVLDENSPNHIKMKFVKVSGTMDAEKVSRDALPQVRRRGRPPKSAGKRKTKTKHVEPPISPQPPKLEMMPTHDDDKENESDYEDFVQDPDFDTINPEKSLPEYTRVVRPDPPAEMKKVIVNKKLGETILHRAATLGSMEMTSYCVDYRVVDINARDNAGYTALHESCVKGDLNIAQYLLSHGADVNASAADGTRPIHDAVDNDRVELVRLLLAYGADPFLPTYTGRRTTKLALARNSEMKTLLFGYLQDVNGDRSKLDDAPARPLDYQWSFNGSCSLFDIDTDSETYIFADVPGPEGMDAKSEGDEDVLGIFFETSEKPVLPSFNLRVDGHDKFRNWVLLDQLLERLSMTREELEASHTDLRPVTLPVDQFHQAVQESQVSKATVASSCDDSEVKGERVTLVELDDGLRNVLGVDVDYVR